MAAGGDNPVTPDDPVSRTSAPPPVSDVEQSEAPAAPGGPVEPPAVAESCFIAEDAEGGHCPHKDPGIPGEHRANVDRDPSGEEDGTWKAEDGNPFDTSEFWGMAPGKSSPARRQAAGADCEATPAPAGTGDIEDIWGSAFDGMTPNMTLKGPRGPKPPPLGMLPTATTEVPPNLSVDGYDLLDVLGEGGVGVVYQAVQKSVDRQIAVKMIKPAIDQDPAEKAKFISEALVTGYLDHPNIVPIHDLGTTKDGKPFYTMKMVRGTPWHEVIRSNSLSENLRILLDACDAVSFAHSKGVIHRDLKPENVMLGEFGEVQVMDWGLGASIIDTSKTAPLTQSHAAGGTPAYMAPEMVTGKDGPVGYHSDVYLLGALLYEIVAGKPPHAGLRVLDCLRNAADNVIEPTDRRGPLADIALKAMQTNPADRYPSAKAFKQAILDYQAHAESIDLCERSTEDLGRAIVDRDYELFAQALFGFREAVRLWGRNAEAQAGITDTQYLYAHCAFEKGDFDLAASTLEADCPTHQELLAEITNARHRRQVVKRRLRRFRTAAICLTAAVIVILAGASFWISTAKRQEEVAKEAAIAAKRQAIAAKEDAVAAQHAETRQRQRAEAAMAMALQEEARAAKALADLEQAVQAMVEARTKEERAEAKARAADLVAARTRDELAKSGMLLDNSWWVFDPESATRKQAAAAESLGMPARLTVPLSNGETLGLVLIPHGEFVMGSPPAEEARAADEHLHRVRHTRAFYLGKFEVTETQWLAVTGRLPENAQDRGADASLPAVGISFEQITREFLPALQAYAPDGYAFRLATEAEWEYACRAGTAGAYHTGDGADALDAAGWFLSNSRRKVQPVGQKRPNAFGLYDMHGNVGEICTDQYVAGFYLESSTDDPIGPPAGERPIVRGGSVLNTPEHCRAAYRSYVYSRNRYEMLGLRVALVPKQTNP